MKKLICLLLSLVPVSLPASPDGGKPVIPDQVFQAAGLSKLTPEELTVLEKWIQTDRVEVAVATEEKLTVDLPKGDDAFGVEQISERVAKIFQREEKERIETRIDGELKGWGGGTYFHLQNGQVWRQIDNDRMRYNLDNAEVVIFRAAMGTYFLKPRKLNSRVRVERVK